MRLERLMVFNIKVRDIVSFILITFALFVAFQPDYFSTVGFLELMNQYFRIMVIIFLIVYVFLFGWGYSFKISLIISAFYILQAFLDYYHDEDIQMNYFMMYIAISFFFELKLQENFKFTIKLLAILLGIYICINLFTVFMFPEGLFLSAVTQNPCYFLGHRNTIVKIAIPAIICESIYFSMDHKKKAKLFTALIWLINFIVEYKVWSGSGMISLAVLAAVYIITCFYPKLIMCWEIYVTGICAFLCISIFRLQDKMAFIIEDILHKDLSMTGRTNFWDIGISFIKKNFFTGTGRISSIYLGKDYVGFQTLHSFYLDTLFRGGIILTLVLTIVILYSTKNISSIKNNSQKAILNAGLAGYLCLGLVEPISDNIQALMFLIMIIGYWTVRFCNENKIEYNC